MFVCLFVCLCVCLSVCLFGDCLLSCAVMLIVLLVCSYLAEKLATTESVISEENSGAGYIDASQIFHDTAGWKGLDTGMRLCVKDLVLYIIV